MEITILCEPVRTADRYGDDIMAEKYRNTMPDGRYVRLMERDGRSWLTVAERHADMRPIGPVLRSVTFTDPALAERTMSLLCKGEVTIALSVISDGQARRIAAYWHSPSPYDEGFCALSHTGAILSSLRDEISREVQLLPVGEDRRELLALDKYVRRAGERGPVGGWSGLWSDDPVTVDHC